MRTINWLIGAPVILSNIVGYSQDQVKDSLDVMIGQMIMVGVADLGDSILIGDVKAGAVGGVVLYEKNIPSSSPWIHLKQDIYDLQAHAPVPLWIAIDQEGGKVNRLKSKYGFPPSVTAAYLGGLDHLDSTRFYAELTATTLAGLGINVNFAPVVDLAVNPDNPVIVKSGRSYGKKPELVARHASEVVAVHRRYGILTILKHFPGHGSSSQDTHLDMADVTVSWNRAELLPYQMLIDSGIVDAIMTAHIVNGQLDSTKVPATLSRPIIQYILRDSLAFDGVVFSDDLHMHAISKHFSLEKAVFMSIDAGVDVLLLSNNIADTGTSGATEIRQIIRKLVDQGLISPYRIKLSYNRIITLKAKYGEDL